MQLAIFALGQKVTCMQLWVISVIKIVYPKTSQSVAPSTEVHWCLSSLVSSNPLLPSLAAWLLCYHILTRGSAVVALPKQINQQSTWTALPTQLNNHVGIAYIELQLQWRPSGWQLIPSPTSIITIILPQCRPLHPFPKCLTLHATILAKIYCQSPQRKRKSYSYCNRVEELKAVSCCQKLFFYSYVP